MRRAASAAPDRVVGERVSRRRCRRCDAAVAGPWLCQRCAQAIAEHEIPLPWQGPDDAWLTSEATQAVLVCRRCGSHERKLLLGLCLTCFSKLSLAQRRERRNRIVGATRGGTEPGAADRAALLRRAGVPEGLTAYHWSTQPRPEGVNLGQVRSWRGDPPMLLILGPTGVGKTGLAVNLLADWVEAGTGGRFCYWPATIAELREEAGGGGRGRLEALIGVPGLLVIDDVGSPRITEFEAEALLRLLEGRLCSRRATLLTANSLDGLLGSDDRLKSRALSGIVILAKGPDRRLQRLAGFENNLTGR